MKKVPNHLGIIMDGNRRWARNRGLPTLEGHRRGYNKVKKVGDWCLDRGIKILTVYAFSTENWNRSKKEVGYLMKLLKKALTDDIQEMHQKNIQVRVIGRVSQLSKDLQKAVRDAVKLTKKNTKGILNIALNYGGRPEIVDAIRKVVRKKVPITEAAIADNLYTAGLPDPDLIIRTSGEYRLSNFLTWQASYSELMFIDKHWPAFTEKDLDKAIKEYQKRNRRFGGN
ncbi:MAG: polyprenyl diphosphate synthase [Patescibacteria group bacterium]